MGYILLGIEYSIMSILKLILKSTYDTLYSMLYWILIYFPQKQLSQNEVAL